MFTDLVDSSALARQLGDAEYVRHVLEPHNAIFRLLLAQFPLAREIKHTGDGFMATFASASDAAQCALHFHHALRTATWQRVTPQTRVGIHLGEAIEFVGPDGSPKDLAGDAANVAARVMSLAEPGQTLLTKAAFDSARQSGLVFPPVVGGPVLSRSEAGEPVERETTNLELRWLAYGRYRFKGADDPFEVCEIGLVGESPLRAPAGSEKASQDRNPVTKAGRQVRLANHWVVWGLMLIIIALTFVLLHKSGMLWNSNSAPLNSSQASHLVVSPFEIEQVHVTIDLTERKTVPPGKEAQKISPDTATTRLKLRRLDDHAHEYHYRLATSSQIDPEVKCLTHPFKLVPINEQIMENTHAWNLVIDLSGEPLGKEVEVIYQTTYWNAYRGETNEWSATHVLHFTKLLELEILFPEQKPMKAYRLYMVDRALGGPKEKFRDVPEAENQQGKRFVWRLRNPNPNRIYRVDWDW
jgi:class 3 adenylate cyclase